MKRRIPGLVVVYDTNLFQLYTEDHHVRSLFGDLAISISLGEEDGAQDTVLGKSDTDRSKESFSECRGYNPRSVSSAIDADVVPQPIRKATARSRVR